MPLTHLRIFRIFATLNILLTYNTESIVWNTIGSSCHPELERA